MYYLIFNYLSMFIASICVYYVINKSKQCESIAEAQEGAHNTTVQLPQL